MVDRVQLTDEMNRLRHDLLTMGARVEEDLGKAMLALETQDAELAREVKADDEVVNALQIKIEDEVAVLIATQQPVAGDLRALVAALKVTDNLERAGDHAVHLAKAAAKLSGEPSFRQVERLGRMAASGREMVRRAVAAYLASDAAEARAVAALDDAIDHEHKAAVDEVLAFMRDHPDQVERANRIIKTAGFLERLGDHMTNVCEAVVYMVEGSHVELNE